MILGHREIGVPSLWQMPVAARFGEVEGREDTFLEVRPLPEEPKPPGSWSTFLEFPRTFFFLKASDLGRTSLARRKAILVPGEVFRVPFANWMPCLHEELEKSRTSLDGFPSLGTQGQ